MLKGIFNTMSGKYITERRMEIVANNIANASTPGYKTTRPMVNVVKDESVSSNNGQSVDTYINILDSYIHFSDAPLVESRNTLDLGIEGDGFFVVSTKDGNMYTRNGQFTLDKDKKLVTLSGNPVMGQGGEITLDGKQGGDIRIEGDGSIFVDKILVDKLKIVDFKDKKDLQNFGSSLYINMNKDNVENTPDKFSVRQGFYEASNVDVMKEMIEMMSTLRAYESYSKVDQFFSDMMDKLINIGRF